MTELQKRFCEEFIVDCNITNAGKRAGVQGDNVNIVSWQIYQLPEVKEYISELRQGQSDRTMITADRVLSEISRLAFSDIRDYYHEDGLLKLPNELSDDAAAALYAIEVDEMFDLKGNKIGDTKKIKLYDKLNALDKLARRLGLFSEDNKQKSQPIQLLNFDPINAVTGNDSPAEDISTT